MKSKIMLLTTVIIAGITAGWLSLVPVLDVVSEKGLKFAVHNGPWSTRLDYGSPRAPAILRAVVARRGLGANTAEETVYWTASTDSKGDRLLGGRTYAVGFSGEPAIRKKMGFWSLTLYNSKDFFVPNKLKRYALGDRSWLRRNLDGSFTILISPKQPDDVANWLPSPGGEEPFSLVLRMYAPMPGVLSQPEKSAMPFISRLE